MKTITLWLLMTAALLIQGCGGDKEDKAEEKAASQDNAALLMMFKESEPGVDSYTSRTIVTPQYMRMDFNDEGEDFILFDRKSRTVYSVTSSDKTILVISPREVTIESPIKLDLGEERVKMDDNVPKVAGRTPKHYRFKANGNACFEAVMVPGLLEDATAAMRDYLKVLAGEQAQVLPVTPADMLTPCDLAIHTFAPGWHLSHGFPIQEWHTSGYSRTLENYDEHYVPDPALFQLPEDYRRYSPGDLPMGLVD